MMLMLSPTKVRKVEPVLYKRVYSVSDLVAPIPRRVVVSTDGGAAFSDAPSELEADFDALIEQITGTVSPETWEKAGGPGTVVPWPNNLSVVVSQTHLVHEEIVDLFEHLRRFQGIQVRLDMELVQMPQAMAKKIEIDGAPGENDITLAPREARLLRAYAEESASAGIQQMPAVTLCNGQQAEMAVAATHGEPPKESGKILLQTVVSDDFRKVELTVALNPDGSKQALSKAAPVSVPDGRTLVCDVSKQLPKAIWGNGMPVLQNVPDNSRLFRQRDDGEDRRTLLLVTPSVVIQEEEEERLVIGGVTPKIIIQEEEEERLGIGIEP
jgi:hypothetical protein